MEEKETVIETENVEESVEILDKTQAESKKMSPKEKKATWIIGSIGVFLVAALTTIIIAGTINDEARANHPVYYYFDWNKDLPGFYDKDDKFIGENLTTFEAKKDNAENLYYEITKVSSYSKAVTYVLPSVHGEGELKAPVQSISTSNGENSIFNDYQENIAAIYAQSFYKNIGSYVFANLPALKKVEFRSASAGKQDIGHHAFYGDTALTQVTLANNLNILGESAFEGCSSLTEITLSNSLAKIGANVFKGCNMGYINFNGTRSQWNAVTKEEGWDEGLSECYIQLLQERENPYIYIE